MRILSPDDYCVVEEIYDSAALNRHVNIIKYGEFHNELVANIQRRHGPGRASIYKCIRGKFSLKPSFSAI